MNIYDTLCISGGGIKGFAFVGALEYLFNKSFIDYNKINTWVGTSIGSILCFLLILGYNIHEIGEFIYDFNFESLQTDINIDYLLESFGVNNGIKIMVLLSNFLKEKYNLEDINFIDLYNLTKKKLIIIGTNYSKGIETIFNHETYPEMSVITAIRISISIPFFFEPVLFNNDYYIDGAFSNNFPINHCDPKTTFGIYIKHTNIKNNLNNILELFVGCLNILADSITQKNFYNNYTILEIESNDIEFLKFELSIDTKLKLILLGQNLAKKFLIELEAKKLIEKSKEFITEINENKSKSDQVIIKEIIQENKD
jgi:predicted acylesterase/phospholipase RssA